MQLPPVSLGHVEYCGEGSESSVGFDKAILSALSWAEGPAKSYSPEEHSGSSATSYLAGSCRACSARVGLSAVVLWLAVVNLSFPPLGFPGESPKRSFEQRLLTRLESYESGGRTFVQALLDLVYQHRLPAALEYLDADAVRKPLNVTLRHTTVRHALVALAGQLPQYRLNFSSGLVEVYSSRARGNPSSMLNVVIQNFRVEEADPRMAGYHLFGALSATLHPGRGYGGSFAPLGGPKKITLHLRKAKVHDILNAIVAQRGDAIWIVRVPPERLSTFQVGLWYLYSLDEQWKHVVLEDAERLFPASEPQRR